MSAAAPNQLLVMERLMKPKEVAPLFGVEESTVKTWARTGKIPSTRTPGGEIRVRPSDVAELLGRPAAELPAQNANEPARCATTERAL